MQQITEEQRKEWEEKLKKMSPEELKEFQKQQCVFCQIVGGKVPAKKVYGDDKCIAVMDINPAAIGHVLLMPKEHYAIMPQIPEEEIGHLFRVSKQLSQVMLRKLKVEGTNIFVANGLAAGQKAQHFMIHIIPRKEGDGVLEIGEHLVEEGIRNELGIKLGNKVNELLGIKKEKVKIEEEGKGKEGKEKESKDKENGEGKVERKEVGEKEAAKPVSGDKSKKEMGKKKGKEKEEEEEKEKEEEKEGEEEQEEKEEEESEEEKEAEGEEGEEEKEEGASLDDIANLFR